MIRTKAIRLNQNGRVLYIMALPAGTLVKDTTVDVWDPADESGEKGYQRAPSSRRKREVAQYVVRDDAIMPLGGLLNARARNEGQGYGSVLKFEPDWEDGATASGWLTIPDTALPLYVVDMQHRIGGYEFAIEEMGEDQLQRFPLVVTVADGLSLSEEVDQFELINTTQRKVRTDLARRLKAVQIKDPDKRRSLDERGVLWEARGPKVVAILTRDEGGAWFRRIVPPNAVKKDYPDAVVRETSFVTSLKPILQSPYFSRLCDEDCADLINRYWKAISELYEAAMSHASEYVLQKTPGIFALHAIATEVFEIARDRGGLSHENLVAVLSGVRAEYDDMFWAGDVEDGAAQYGSMKGFKILASKLRQCLPVLRTGGYPG